MIIPDDRKLTRTEIIIVRVIIAIVVVTEVIAVGMIIWQYIG